MASNRLSDYVGNRDNNFNLIRFIAASMVIVSHSYPLALGKGNWDPFKELSGGLTFGTLAVDVFFVTSGFLITGSLMGRKGLVAFAWARFLRIYPGLFVAIMFCVLVVGLFFTTWSIGAYLTSTDTLLFVLKDTSLVWKLGYNLPGVFQDNPYPFAVNGSLWTLPWEVRMYVLLAVLSIVFRNAFRRSLIALVIFSLTVIFTLKYLDYSGPKYVFDAFRFISFFFLGSLFFVYKEKILLRGQVFLLLLLAAIASLFVSSVLFYVFYVLFLPYVVFYLR